MIIVVLAPNDNDAPDATIDDHAGTVGTVASAMSRNAALPSSTWTAAQ